MTEITREEIEGKSITCPHCHGIGLDPDKGKRTMLGRSVDWTFKLSDQCPVCRGTGKVRSS